MSFISCSPVGRALKDLDIFGIADTHNFISDQVKYQPIGAANWKLEKLVSYSKKMTSQITFVSVIGQKQLMVTLYVH